MEWPKNLCIIKKLKNTQGKIKNVQGMMTHIPAGYMALADAAKIPAGWELFREVPEDESMEMKGAVEDPRSAHLFDHILMFV